MELKGFTASQKKKKDFSGLDPSLRGKSNLAFEHSVVLQQIYLYTHRQVYTYIDAHTYSYGFIILGQAEKYPVIKEGGTSG